MTDIKNTIAKIVTWGVRLGAIAYLGNSAIQGDLGANVETIITGGIWGTVELTNAILFALKTFIPFKTVDAALQNIKSSMDENTYNAIVKFVVNNIPQLSELLEKQSGELTTIFAILKANALISYDNNLYDSNPEAKQIIEAFIK
jgi:hypothetical protein